MTNREYDDTGYEDKKGRQYRRFKDKDPIGIKIAALVGVVGYLVFPDAIVFWVILVFLLGGVLTRRRYRV